MKPCVSGVYRITNLLNGKVYIGQSRNIWSRYKNHFCQRYPKNDRSYIHYAISHYGKENFSFEILKETYDLNYWEMFLIQIHHSSDPEYGYNLTSGGTYGTRRLSDFEYTDDIKKKMSDKAKQRWKDPVYRFEILNAQNKGKQGDDWKNHRRDIANRMWRNGNFKDQARKLSEYWTGKPKSEETKAKMRIASEKRELRHSEEYRSYVDLGGKEPYKVFKTFYKKGVNLLLEEMKNGTQSRN